ncbi:MAG: fibronectin type III-like domain-contianing protein [Spirochaetales bacterium]|nr:fibronectin type III-like domain-contianing protein [Spirochaetales bacterium]
MVQVYARDLYASLVRPMQELKAFKRVSLEPGETKSLKFTLPADILSFTGAGEKRIVEPGEFDIMVGTSSRDIAEHLSINLTGSVRTLGEKWRMESQAEVL